MGTLQGEIYLEEGVVRAERVLRRIVFKLVVKRVRYFMTQKIRLLSRGGLMNNATEGSCGSGQ